MANKHLFTGCIVLGLSLALGSAHVMAQSKPPVAVNAPDIQETFLRKAVQGNAFEIQTSQLALERTNTPEVRAFAQQMITDHTKAKDELAVLLKNLNITEPSAALEPAQIEQIKLMQGVQNDQFDLIYIPAQTNAHIDAVAAFREFSASGSPPPVRDWAAKTLPTLEQHLAHIQKMKR